MPIKGNNVKITIIKINVDTDLAREYLIDEYKDISACEIFKKGQEFIINGYNELIKIPDGFCPSAWADIRKDQATIMQGAETPWMKQNGVTIVGCSDWFRPVIFKIERIQS